MLILLVTLYSIWTKYTLLAIPGSFVFTMGFLPLYAWIAPMLGFSLEYTNIVGRLWSSLVFWLTIFGLPFVLLTRDFAWKSFVLLSHLRLSSDPTDSLSLAFYQVQAIVPTRALSYRTRDSEVQSARLSTTNGAVPKGTLSLADALSLLVSVEYSCLLNALV